VPDDAPLFHRVADRHQLLAEMQVSSDDALAMVEVNHVTAKIKSAQEANHAAVRGAHRRTHCAGVIRAHVTAGDGAVKSAPTTEWARDARGAWYGKRPRP
jgi:hypothetical protein